MKRDEIREVFEQLAMSQGFYGRLLRQIDEADEEARERFWEDLEEQNFKDSLDLILYIEG